MQQPASYLLAGQASEFERLQLQSKVWEPAARELLAAIPAGEAPHALEVGCGVMGWLRALSQWAGPNGRVTGSDFDDKMLAGAAHLVDTEHLANVTLVKDDLFASRLEPGAFDLVHARFQIAPLGRAKEQLAAFMRWVRPGGVLVLEDPDTSSWRVNPDAPSVQELIALIERGFVAAGGNFNSGRELPALLRSVGLQPNIRARVVALEPGHPYLRLPLQFAASLRPRLEKLVSADELDALLQRAEAELSREGTWGTTFTLVQAWAVAGP
ncbi:MAG: methyltransferase domain-containing protein [Burkholderiales bacterium]|nr:methyltransferase domain-containing protein [Burkholderiales bacterium]